MVDMTLSQSSGKLQVPVPEIYGIQILSLLRLQVP